MKVTVIVQEAPAATPPEQVFTCENELEFVPVMEMPLIVSAAVPVLDSVVDCVVVSAVPSEVAAKVRDVGERLTIGAFTVTDVVADPDA